uniref:ATP synthase complex subunit 8 n=1 Tax=Ophiarachnella gorgonia TaxID=1365872 RepID=A0A6C0FJS7_9ECHI|nr:ATP synthase F0 subunit 8 [Ophiarachnella gorgonia]QHT54250.1 ATP synthase F0 subunit 8 [Ophiarachnella gorgonia]
MPQLEFNTWLIFLITNWITLNLFFLLLNNYNNQQNINNETNPSNTQNFINWNWN